MRHFQRLPLLAHCTAGAVRYAFLMEVDVWMVALVVEEVELNCSPIEVGDLGERQVEVAWYHQSWCFAWMMSAEMVGEPMWVLASPVAPGAEERVDEQEQMACSMPLLFL